MFKLFTFGIFLLNFILIEANEYCELEALYCEGRLHVGCNKITNPNTNEIIELTPYLHQRLIQNLNKFRDDVAHGLRTDVTHLEVSNMNILQWNTKLELLSGNASLKLKQNGLQNLCYATSEYPDPVLISLALNEEHEIKDINTEFIDLLTTSLIKKYEKNSALSNPSSHDIGCALTKADKLNSYFVACILYGIGDVNNFKFGIPCSNCDSNACDSIYQGLCINQQYGVIESLANTQETTTKPAEFELNDTHIYAVYMLLGGLIILIILMLVLIKYLYQYNSHISL